MRTAVLWFTWGHWDPRACSEKHFSCSLSFRVPFCSRKPVSSSLKSLSTTMGMLLMVVTRIRVLKSALLVLTSVGQGEESLCSHLNPLIYLTKCYFWYKQKLRGLWATPATFGGYEMLHVLFEKLKGFGQAKLVDRSITQDHCLTSLIQSWNGWMDNCYSISIAQILKHKCWIQGPSFH